jgi:hypothetical protein
MKEKQIYEDLKKSLEFLESQEGFLRDNIRETQKYISELEKGVSDDGSYSSLQEKLNCLAVKSVELSSCISNARYKLRICELEDSLRDIYNSESFSDLCKNSIAKELIRLYERVPDKKEELENLESAIAASKEYHHLVYSCSQEDHLRAAEEIGCLYAEERQIELRQAATSPIQEDIDFQKQKRIDNIKRSLSYLVRE